MTISDDDGTRTPRRPQIRTVEAARAATLKLRVHIAAHDDDPIIQRDPAWRELCAELLDALDQFDARMARELVR